MLSRRSFVIGIGAAGLAAPFPGTRLRAQEVPIADAPPDFDDAALERIFVDNAEPLAGEYVVKGLYDYELWWEQEPPLEMAQWPPDARTIDYAHLPAWSSDQPFLLDDTALRRLVASHAYARLVPGNPLVLFGIRGARRAGESSSSPAFERRIELLDIRPDHFDHQCLLGVWDTRNRTVWATAASTVPHVAYLFAQRAAGTFGGGEANMMPTGLYRYAVGTHRNGSSSFQPGAFRPDSKAFAVLRCVEEGPLVMSRDQYWDTQPTHHGDNIHAGTYSTRPDRPKFWSAGCQVIPGYYEEANTVPQGNWARFRLAAGLERTPVITRKDEIEHDDSPPGFIVETSEDGRRYSYILTTGRDIALAGRKIGRAHV